MSQSDRILRWLSSSAGFPRRRPGCGHCERRPDTASRNETLLKDMANKAAMTESGFDNIANQLTRDDYASFIRR